MIIFLRINQFDQLFYKIIINIMGNQQCEQCKQLKSSNVAYGEYEICHQDGKQLALIQKKMEIQKGLAQKIQKELIKRTKIVSKHIVRLVKFQISKLEYQINVSLYYEYMPKTLREVIEEYSFKEQNFTQNQLFSIIYGVQSGLTVLNDLSIQHSCINLDTILYKNNVFKITDISSTTYLTAYELVLQGNRQQFLSQKLINNLNYKVIRPTDSNIYDDLFSLGLIILMIIVKGKPGNFYSWKKSEKLLLANFNTKYIEHCIRLMNRNYSSKLANKVKSLVFGDNKQKTKGPQSQQGSTLIGQLKDLQSDLNRIMNKINMKNIHPRILKDTPQKTQTRYKSFR